MIFFLVKERHAYTINDYLESWAPALVPVLTPVFYEQLNDLVNLGPGTYIFSDIDRLSNDEAERLAQECESVSRIHAAVRLLNHPTQSMGRYELLRTLYDRGWNNFNLYRLDERRRPDRFPVFLRGECDHAGNISPLIHSPEALERALRRPLLKRTLAPKRLFRTVKRLSRPGGNLRGKWKHARNGRNRNSLLMTEFCNTADEHGVYRKYSAFVVGERILPQHIFFSSDWMVKRAPSSLPDEAQLREEREYVETNQHEPLLRQVFELARIAYGRIDYSIDRHGRLQVWEINTNPTIFSRSDPASQRNVMRRPLREHFSREFQAALAAIDSSQVPHVLNSAS